MLINVVIFHFYFNDFLHLCFFILFLFYIYKIEILLYFKTKYYNIDVTPQIKKKGKKKGFWL